MILYILTDMKLSRFVPSTIYIPYVCRLRYILYLPVRYVISSRLALEVRVGFQFMRHCENVKDLYRTVIFTGVAIVP